MGNANGREEGGNAAGDSIERSAGDSGYRNDFPASSDRSVRVAPLDPMGSTPPEIPGRSLSPLMFAPQTPVAPLSRPADGRSVCKQPWLNESHGPFDLAPEQGIPTMITWSYGGNDVIVEGSWDDWMSRKTLQKSGKDHSILLVLPSGIYRYRFIVDGEWRYIPDLPCEADEMGHVTNLLDVNGRVAENLESVAEFELPPSPDSSYSQPFPGEEDFAKEPPAIPPQLHLTVLGVQNSNSPETSKPQHVVLNHLFIEKGWASQSLVALGLTHRFQAKYVTVVLYKPLRSLSLTFSKGNDWDPLDVQDIAVNQFSTL